MPTRLLREGILSSDRVNELDFPAEVFYRRLMSKVDDHGLYDARVSVLRSSLYPLKVDRVRVTDISRWMAACQKAGLIVLFEAGGKPYLQMLDTKWERRGQPKYPIPNDSQLETSVNIRKQALTDSPVVGDVVVGVVVGTPMSGKPDVDPQKNNGHDLQATARGVLAFLNEKTGRRYQPVEANLSFIVARLRGGATERELRQVVAKKCREWGSDEKMAMYLRPATLFNDEKFAQYQGELGAVS